MKKTINGCFCQKTAKNLLVTFILFIIYFSLNAQNSFAFNPKNFAGQHPPQKQQKVTVRVKNEKLSVVLARIERQVPYVFVYSDDDVNASQRLSLEANGEDLNTVLESISRLANLNFEIINDKIILRSKLLAIDSNAVVNSILIEQASAIGTDEKSRRAEAIVTGKITDEDGNGIVGASVTVKGTSVGVTTNSNGNYSLSIPDNISNPVLLFSYIGYTNQEIALEGRRTLNVVLQKIEKVLEDVVVRSKK